MSAVLLPTDLEPAADLPGLRHVLLWVQFDGTDFAGFQRQIAGIRTVAGELEAGWLRRFGEVGIARSSSRTDSGVHARRMPVLFRTGIRNIPARGLMLALNSRLPPDLAVVEADDVPAEFDVRSDAVGKRYIYRITSGEARLPLWRRSAWHVRGPLDLDAMREAAARFEGVHDFAAFRGAQCVAKSTIRNLRCVEVGVEPLAGHALSPVVSLTVDGNAFLLNMVRIIAGTVTDVGRGRLNPDDVPRMLASRERVAAGQTAPAHGLTLDDVFYGPAGARQGRDYKAMLANMALARGA